MVGDYLESTGTQLINTYMPVVEDEEIYFDAICTEIEVGDHFLIDNGNNLWVSLFESTSTNPTWYVRFGSNSSVKQQLAASNIIGTKHNYLLKKQNFSVDGVQLLTPTFDSLLNDSKLSIFGRLNSSSYSFVSP